MLVSKLLQLSIAHLLSFHAQQDLVCTSWERVNLYPDSFISFGNNHHKSAFVRRAVE